MVGITRTFKKEFSEAPYVLPLGWRANRILWSLHEFSQSGGVTWQTTGGDTKGLMREDLYPGMHKDVLTSGI